MSHVEVKDAPGSKKKKEKSACEITAQIFFFF